MPKILNVRLSDAQQKKIRKYIARELILVVMPHWMMKNPQALKQNKSSGDSSETGKEKTLNMQFDQSAYKLETNYRILLHCNSQCYFSSHIP